MTSRALHLVARSRFKWRHHWMQWLQYTHRHFIHASSKTKQNFPVITHIDQVREAIRGTQDFVEIDHGSYIAFNNKRYTYHTYNVDAGVTPEIVALRRECRGIIFRKDNGKLISRPYHKFFNLGENENYSLHAVAQLLQEGPHYLLEKVDGTMAVPFVVEGRLRWGTRSGATSSEITRLIEDYASTHSGYVSLARMMVNEGITPIFEFCSPKHRIVINHPTTRLILTAMRYNETGNYMPYDDLVALARRHSIPLVAPFMKRLEEMNLDKSSRIYSTARAHSISNLAQLVSEIGALNFGGIEGAVIRFADGDMVKVKTGKYIHGHLTRSKFLRNERQIWLAVLSGRVDDIKANIASADPWRVALDNFTRDLLTALEKRAWRLTLMTERAKKDLQGDRAKFNKLVLDKINTLDRAVMVAVWKGRFGYSEVVEQTHKLIEKAEENLELARSIVGGLRWQDYYDDDTVVVNQTSTVQ